MGSIYANATVTIIASTGEDPAFGLSGMSSRLRSSQPQFETGTHLLVSTMPRIDIEIYSSRWNIRGWTYQEALLSTRRLVFTDSQVYFQCSSMHCLESLALPLDSLHMKDDSGFYEFIELPQVFPSRGANKYTTAITDRIKEYNVRQLSFETNALDAFRGIFQGFKTLKCPLGQFRGLPLFPTEIFKLSALKPISNPITKTDKLAVALTWSPWERQCVVLRFLAGLGRNGKDLV